VDTPGYRAQNLRFEDAIKSALKQVEPKLSVSHAAHLAAPAQPVGAPTLAARSGGSLRADGNNVSIDTELVDMTETGIKYQALTQVVSKKLQLLKSIATAR
jgi:flagellar basal-body rod protein FlgB